MGIKAVYVDEETEVIWRNLFGGKDGNASGWIKEALKKEAGKYEDPFFILKEICELQESKKSIEKKIVELQERIEAIKKNKPSKSMMGRERGGTLPHHEYKEYGHRHDCQHDEVICLRAGENEYVEK